MTLAGVLLAVAAIARLGTIVLQRRTMIEARRSPFDASSGLFTAQAFRWMLEIEFRRGARDGIEPRIEVLDVLSPPGLVGPAIELEMPHGWRAFRVGIHRYAVIVPPQLVSQAGAGVQAIRSSVRALDPTSNVRTVSVDVARQLVAPDGAEA